MAEIECPIWRRDDRNYKRSSSGVDMSQSNIGGCIQRQPTVPDHDEKCQEAVKSWPTNNSLTRRGRGPGPGIIVIGSWGTLSMKHPLHNEVAPAEVTTCHLCTGLVSWWDTKITWPTTWPDYPAAPLPTGLVCYMKSGLAISPSSPMCHWWLSSIAFPPSESHICHSPAIWGPNTLLNIIWKWLQAEFIFIMIYMGFHIH